MEKILTSVLHRPEILRGKNARVHSHENEKGLQNVVLLYIIDTELLTQCRIQTERKHMQGRQLCQNTSHVYSFILKSSVIQYQ